MFAAPGTRLASRLVGRGAKDGTPGGGERGRQGPLRLQAPLPVRGPGKLSTRGGGRPGRPICAGVPWAPQPDSHGEPRAPALRLGAWKGDSQSALPPEIIRPWPR